MAEYELTVAREVWEQLRSIRDYPIGSASFNDFDVVVNDAGEAPSFGGSTWDEANGLYAKYEPVYSDLFAGTAAFRDKIRELADIAGRLAAAYDDTERDVEKDAEALATLVDVDLPRLTDAIGAELA